MGGPNWPPTKEGPRPDVKGLGDGGALLPGSAGGDAGPATGGGGGGKPTPLGVWCEVGRGVQAPPKEEQVGTAPLNSGVAKRTSPQKGPQKTWVFQRTGRENRGKLTFGGLKVPPESESSGNPHIGPGGAPHS